MPLPQQVIEQLGRETPESQGWAWGAMLFSGGILFLVIVIYIGLLYGSESYWNKQLNDATAFVNAASAKVSSNDQSQIINFYSQTSNLKSVLANHQFTSQFFTWLENNTEANVYYQSLQLSSGGKVTLKGAAKTEADVNQQIAIYESSPSVTSVALSGVSVAPSGSGFIFTATLTMDPSVFASPYYK